MAKQTVVIVLIIAAMAFGSASAYTSPKCEMELLQYLPMRKCLTWVESKMKTGYEEEKEEEQLEQCCSELRQMSSECHCNAVKEMMMLMSRMKEMMMMCQLPAKCGMSPCNCPGAAAFA